MKVEIAENMLYSWLRHCMGCQIVQTNYKVAKQWNKTKDMKGLFNDFQADARFEDCHFTTTRKGKIYPQSFLTVLNAAECDLVGVLFGGNNTSKVFAYESAFHESGTKYDNTPKKVMQKIFKNYLMTRSFFPDGEVELAFVSPKMKADDLAQIKANLKNLKSFISVDHGDTAVNLEIVTGRDFKSKILSPLYKMIGEITDESELFIRAVKLLKMMTEAELGKTK